MKAVEFEGHNIVFGENQPQYHPLPALIIPGEEGQVITCWEFTPEELQVIQKTGRMYISHMTFNGPMQPLLPAAEMADFFGFIED